MARKGKVPRPGTGDFEMWKATQRPRPEWIDPEIRQLVLDLNQLPFVLRTEFCCAGIGPRHPTAWDPSVRHSYRERGGGYLTMVYYRREEARRFHNRMDRIMDGYGRWERLGDGYDSRLGRSLTRRVYRMTRLDARQPTTAQVREKWKRVHALICTYLKEGK